jgi:hypothetical protein
MSEEALSKHRILKELPFKIAVLPEMKFPAKPRRRTAGPYSPEF